MVKFIAEICSNHNGGLGRALRLIEAAKEAGCDGVKFQLFRIDQLFHKKLLHHRNYSQMLNSRRAWELPLEWLEILAEHCHIHGLEFGCTPFYIEAVAALKPYVDFYKVASYELLWSDLLSHILAATDKPVILSTGMATMTEIKSAIYSQQIKHWETDDRLTILHCISRYGDLTAADCHLAFMRRLWSEVNAVAGVGYSDHSVNAGAILRAVHRYQAQVIEFHLDLDDQNGSEFHLGHCWTASQIKPVIEIARDGLAADGDENFDVTANGERHFRADPADGLRPMAYMRGRL